MEGSDSLEMFLKLLQQELMRLCWEEYLPVQKKLPGEVELYQGRSFKTYRGMGSLGAMSERNDVNRYSQDGVEQEKMVPEGVEGRVPFKGWVVSVIDQLTGGIKTKYGVCWL